MSWLYLGDILFIAGYVGFFSIFSGLVHPMLIMPYMIWNALIGLILTRRSDPQSVGTFWHCKYCVFLSGGPEYHQKRSCGTPAFPG